MKAYFYYPNFRPIKKLTFIYLNIFLFKRYAYDDSLYTNKEHLYLLLIKTMN